MKLEYFIENVATGRSFDHADGTDIWHFHQHQKIKINNTDYLKIATSQDGSELSIMNNSDDLGSKSLYINNEGYLSYYCFSLTEIFHRKKLIKMFNKLKKSKSIDHIKLLEDFSFDLGCLYWIASGSMTSILDEKNFNEKRNKLTIEKLKEVAEQNDPRACSELASYYCIEEHNPELECYFLRKAALKGDYLSKKKLVEHIVEERNSQIVEAFAILSELKEITNTKAWAYYPEANIFLKAIGLPKDIKRGLQLLETSANLKYPLAMADYAYFLFNGIDIEQNKELAKSLIFEANRLTNGRFSDILKSMN